MKFWFIEKNGTRFPVETSVNCAPYKGRGYLISIRQPHKKEKLERTHFNYDFIKTVTDCFNHIICLVNIKPGRIFEINQKIQNFLGYTYDELYSMSIQDIVLYGKPL